MKYCKNCGMLLEDTQPNCIRCGIDVTVAENVSMYPIEVLETIEQEKQQKKASGKIVAMIIGLVVVLVALVVVFLYAMGGNIPVTPGVEETVPEEVAAVEPEQELPEPQEAEAEPVTAAEPAEEAGNEPASGKAVKDDEGRYYDLISEKDDGGNEVFTALVPEDLTEREFFKDYEIYSDRYSYLVNYTASTKEKDVRFSYQSPRKLWYKLSETGRGRSNESDATHYMTYFEYDGPKSYLEPLLSQSYPDAKIELIEESDVNEAVTAKLEELAKAKNKELFGDIGDYAHIGENTTYANMDYEFSGKIYKYEITLKDKNMLFCKYFVPSMAHNLTYANTDNNDRGNITEWYNFGIVSFETGNEDDYDDYVDDFDIFMANAFPTQLFMYINEKYTEEIHKTVAEGEEVEPLDAAKLKDLGKDYSPDTKPDDFDAGVLDMLHSVGPNGFKGESVTVYGTDKAAVAFFDKDKSKVFISPGADEYPGDQYEELKKIE